VALYQSFTLKSREVVAILVGLGVPHANHGVGAGMPEVTDDLCVLLEMLVQRGPVSR
jgi:hypothetical protein